MRDTYIFFDVSPEEIFEAREEDFRDDLTIEENFVRNNEELKKWLKIVSDSPEGVSVLKVLMTMEDREVKKAVLELLRDPECVEDMMMCQGVSLDRFLDAIE